MEAHTYPPKEWYVQFSSVVRQQQLPKISEIAAYLPPQNPDDKKEKYVVKIVFVPMTSDNENYFEYFIPLKNPKYDDLLGNNKMQLVLKECKMIDFFLSKKRVRRIAYYILELGVILFSMKQCFI